MPSVTKEVFLASRECVGLAWRLLRSETAEELSEGDRFNMDQGREIGGIAREVYAGGIFVPPGETEAASNRTMSLLGDASTHRLYEATFEADGLVAKADIMERDGDGWRLLEVKSGTTDGKEYVEDLAYTVFVARKAGGRVNRASLVLVSGNYRRGMPNRELFEEVDHTADVDALIEGEFADHWTAVSQVLQAAAPPVSELHLTCRYCAHFAEGCIGKSIQDPIIDLPRLSQSKFAKLRDLGLESISEIPGDFELTDNQEIVRRAVASGNREWISPDLGRALSQIRWPAYYLDFETTATVLPLFADVAPWEALPTQYSIHVYSDLDTELAHNAFLADHTKDDRRRLAEQLLRDLSDSGSIVAYSGYEARILKYLATVYPDLADALAHCVARIVDLEGIIKKHFYHADFRGRSSIKQTLPVLVGKRYDDLAIGNGGDASALFARMARGEKTQLECEEIRENLLIYCKQDTEAMVLLHRALTERVA